MGYQPPSLTDLHDGIRKIIRDTRSQRTDSINYLKTLLTITDPNIIIGELIRITEEISRTYPLRSPTNCDLYCEIYRDALNVNAKNPLTAETKLIYLRHAYQYQKQKSKDTAALDLQFQPLVDPLLRYVPHLKMVLSPRPQLENLTDELKSQPAKYEADCIKRRLSPNLDHKKYMALLDIITDEKMMDHLITPLAECKFDQDKTLFKYSVRYGAPLYFMMVKEAEDYSGLTSLVMSPENSVVYTYCQDAIKLTRATDMPDIVKLNFLVDLAKFIRVIKNDEKALNRLKATKLADAGYVYSATYFTDAEVYLDAMYYSIRNLLMTESFSYSCMKWLANYATQTILVMACLEAGAGIYAYGVGKDCVPLVFGKLGRIFLGGSVGEILARSFGKQIEAGVMTNIYANGLWFTGKRIKESFFPPVDPIFKTCAASRKFRTELKDEVTQKQFKPDALLLALVELPSSKITAKVKKRVQDAISSTGERSVVKEVEEVKASSAFSFSR